MNVTRTDVVTIKGFPCISILHDCMQAVSHCAFTCAIVTVHKAGYVGFGLTGYQMGRTKLFQNPIVVILINLPLVIDPKRVRI